MLVDKVDHIVSRYDLTRKLWDDERFANDNTLSVNVNRLHKKLEAIGIHDVIVTKMGLGYYVRSFMRKFVQCRLGV